MRELVRYLIEHTCIDFEGDISMEKVREHLRNDSAPESKALLAKLIEDKGVEDLLLTLADCLREYIPQGVSETVVREQLVTYSEY